MKVPSFYIFTYLGLPISYFICFFNNPMNRWADVLILQMRKLKFSIVRGETKLKSGLLALSSLVFPSITLLVVHSSLADPFEYIKRKSTLTS